MNSEDRAIALQLRRAFAKSPLDISELTVSCFNGCIELTGKVQSPRNYKGGTPLNVRKELENLKHIAHSAHGVKGLYADKLRIMD